MWFRTVCRLRPSSSAICAVERPRSSNRNTSACLGVRCKLGMRVRLLQHVGDLPEHADDVVTAPKGHRADLHREVCALGVDNHQGCVGDLAVADDLARETSPQPDACPPAPPQR